MAYTGATANWAAAAQSNASTVSYAKEETYADKPGGAFQRTRFTGESFRLNDTRQRPEEINLLAEVSQAVTTQLAVSGTLSGALSVGTYDDLLAGIMGADWANDGSIVNNNLVKTWCLHQAIGDGFFLRPGAFCTRAQLSFPQGNFATAAFDFTCARQEKSLVDPAASYIAAPTGAVLDTVGNFASFKLGGQVPVGVLRQVDITITRKGADSDYGIGQAYACGIRPGQFKADGQLQIFFKDWTLYDQYVAGWSGVIDIEVKDATGNGYRFTFLNGRLQSPQINAGSRNTSIVATFDLEGNPQTGGGTFRITRIKPAP